jgi:hypothetical protein
MPLAFLAGVALVGVNTWAAAESVARSDATTDIVGIAETGASSPLPRATSGDAATEGGAYNGWVITNITAVNKSQIPTTAHASCDLYWSVYLWETKAYTTRRYSARAQVTATTINCIVKVPYSLRATNPRTTIRIYPTLSLLDETGAPGASKPTSILVELPGMEFPLPAEGSTTIRNFSTIM